MGEAVEVVEEHKYLSIFLDNRLAWRCSTDAVHEKGQSRLYFFRKLRSFKTHMEVRLIERTQVICVASRNTFHWLLI